MKSFTSKCVSRLRARKFSERRKRRGRTRGKCVLPPVSPVVSTCILCSSMMIHLVLVVVDDRREQAINRVLHGDSGGRPARLTRGFCRYWSDAKDVGECQSLFLVAQHPY